MPMKPSMRTQTAFTLAAMLLAAPAPAWAEEPSEPPARPAVEAFLFAGDEVRNPGDPGTAKLITLMSLYSLSAGSLALGTVFGFQALTQKSNTDDFRDAQPRGFCVDPTAPACVEYDDLRSSQNASARTSGIFLGMGALFFVGGAVTAQLWPNSKTEIAVVPFVSPGEGGLVLRGAL
jgi:hypothetical protein